MVNAGAIATHSHIRGGTPAEKIGAVVDLYSRMANRPLVIEDAWRATPRPLTYTLAYQMKAVDRLRGDVEDAANRYLESNIVAVSVEDLAQMGATLASGGVQPVTRRRVLQRETARTVLSAMVVAGMYEDSGFWWTRVGLPAKSGVSGAILAVVPGWGAIVAYSPRLDPAGNSVRGAIAIRQLAERWRLHSVDRLLDAYDKPSAAP
jgi:glutaminase